MSNEPENELEAAPVGEVENTESEQAEIVDKESEPTPEEVEAEERAAKEKEKRGAQKRIDRLTREKYELKAKAEYLERILTQQPEARQSQQQGLDRDQFASEADYIEAIVEQRLERERQAAETERRERERAATVQKVDKIYSEAEAEGEDFDADEFRVTIAPRMSNLMADAIIESDISAKLLLHFNENPAEVDRIAVMPLARQAVEIGKLEAALSGSSPPKKSAAPAPISKTLGKGKADVGLSDSLSADEWMARRNKQLYGR